MSDCTKFKDNDRVRIVHQRDRVGAVVGTARRQAGECWYKVEFADGRVQNVPERSLEIYEGAQDVETLLRKGVFGNRQTLSSLITVTKTQRPLSNNVYSFRSSRTAFYPHQLRPVLKYLDSPKGRLLIADEVGLGKTIEAGMIMAEERARQDLRRVLIVCPATLREKWRIEMRRRFEEEFEILDSGRMRAFLQLVDERGADARLRGIVSLQTIRSEALLHEFESRLPPLDLVVVDEAHHLRNPETLSHRAGMVLSDSADSMILLTATPIHLGNMNLFYLLRLLDEEEFDEYSAFDRRLSTNEHVIKAQRVLAAKMPVDLARCSAELKRVEHTQEGGRLLENPLYADVLRKLAEYDGNRRDHVIELQRAVSSLNMLAHIFTRTRKAQVQERKATRQPKVLAKTFTPRESAFYDEITEFATGWYEQRMMSGARRLPGMNVSAEGFAAIMLKRQAASSLPALIEQTLRANEGIPLLDLDELWETEDGQAPETVVAQAQTIRHDPSFRLIVDRYKDIEKADSKYDALLTGLRTLDDEQPGCKIVLFSFFKGTLGYLARRLAADGYKCVVVHGDIPSRPGDPDRDERGRRFAEFERDPFVRILLSSEVGSEGIDLQFANVVVNYDLPWNPMVVEQRIGRLDRFGQTADKILIFNFSIPGTIESRILLRLYERIRIFEESIGDIEPILGSEIQQLEREFMTGRLTAAEQQAEVERVANVIEQRRQEMTVLESESQRLLGQDEFFTEELNRVRALGRYVTPDELEVMVRDFLGSRFARSILGRRNDDGTLLFEPKDDFLAFVRHHSQLSDPAFIQFISRTFRHSMLVTFTSEAAFARPDVEFFAVHHPVIRAIAADYAQDRSGLHPVSKIDVRNDLVPPGTYLFIVPLLTVEGIRPRVQLEPVFVSLEGHPVNDANAAEGLLHLMVTQGETLEEVPDFRDEQFETVWDAAQGHFGERLQALQHDLQQSNDALAANRLASLEASYAVKLERQRKRLRPVDIERTFSKQYVTMVEGTIRRLEMELEQKRRAIESHRRVDVVWELLAAGIVRVSAPPAAAKQ